MSHSVEEWDVIYYPRESHENLSGAVSVKMKTWHYFFEFVQRTLKPPLRHSWRPDKPRREELKKKYNSFMVSGLTNFAAPLLFMIFDKSISKTLAGVWIWKLDIAWDLFKSAWVRFESKPTKIDKLTSTFVLRFFKVYLMFARLPNERFGNTGDGGRGKRDTNFFCW